MRVTLLRHAPTAANLASRYVGRTDPPLAPEGVRLARSVGSDLTVELVHTSPLRRAVETARILYPRAELVAVPGLAEMDFGIFENRSWRELEHDPDYRCWLDSRCAARCPGGEDQAGFAARCRDAFLPLLDGGAERLTVVAHGGTIMAVLAALARPARDFFAWTAGYCGGYRLEARDGTLEVVEEIPSPHREGAP